MTGNALSTIIAWICEKWVKVSLKHSRDGNRSVLLLCWFGANSALMGGHKCRVTGLGTDTCFRTYTTRPHVMSVDTSTIERTDRYPDQAKRDDECDGRTQARQYPPHCSLVPGYGHIPAPKRVCCWGHVCGLPLRRPQVARSLRAEAIAKADCATEIPPPRTGGDRCNGVRCPDPGVEVGGALPSARSILAKGRRAGAHEVLALHRATSGVAMTDGVLCVPSRQPLLNRHQREA